MRESTAANQEVLQSIDAAWLFESAPDAMVLVDRHGRIALVNTQTEKMFGYGREQLVGEPVEKLMPERFRTGHVEHRSRYGVTPHTRPMGSGLELFGQHRDEHEFPIEINLAPLQTADGVLISTAIRDVTDLKRAKELNTAPTSVRMTTTDKLCVFFNQRWLAFAGRTFEEELGKGWTSRIHPEDLNRFLETYSAEFGTRSEFTLEYRLRRHDGEYRWIIDRAAPRFDSEGRFLGYLDTCLDINQRKLSELALAEQLKFETVLAGLLSTFIGLTPSQLGGQIVEAQRRICETLGLDRSSLAMIPVEGDDLIITHSWAAAFNLPQRLSKRDLPWVVRRLLDGQLVKFARIEDLPEEAAKDKETLGNNGLKSFVVFPLSAGRRVIGALSFSSLRAEREWPAPLVEQLGVAAQVFANALSRAEADEKLRLAYNEIEELKQRLEKENVYLREEVKLEQDHRDLIGESLGIRRVLKKVEQVAATDSTVLVLGETGTGKELIARTIHDQSPRKARLMVKVNCAALPASLIESELFGREKGAFTGALTRGIGRFELANGSTILLDEVGELPLELQAKLLRVLQEGEFERLGAPHTIKVDVRVIAATSKDLQQAVREGKFREDLFYRLNVFPITIPPLRERREDIPPLVWHFVNELSQRMGRSIESIQGATMENFKKYYWPGNVRELRNVIERFLITSTSTVFRATLPTLETLASAHCQTCEEVERDHILHVMEVVDWRVRGEGGAAQILGLKPTTLESRMQKLGISRKR
ncbi:MAG: sigma 54-interacting transcriptional regulator [Candidatus Korobacteraceae bacterium]